MIDQPIKKTTDELLQEFIDLNKRNNEQILKKVSWSTWKSVISFIAGGLLMIVVNSFKAGQEYTDIKNKIDKIQVNELNIKALNDMEARREVENEIRKTELNNIKTNRSNDAKIIDYNFYILGRYHNLSLKKLNE